MIGPVNDLVIGSRIIRGIFAIPLRKQVIVKEKLPFPSGSATATLISVLHGSDIYQDKEEISEKLDIEEEEGEKQVVLQLNWRV